MAFNVKSEPAKMPLDWLKWLFIWFLMAVIVIGNYYYSDQSVFLRIAYSLIVVVAVLLLGAFTEKGKKFQSFLREAKIELRKVIWPTRQEAVQSTVMVMIVVVIMALFLWGVDSVLLWIYGFFTT